MSMKNQNVSLLKKKAVKNDAGQYIIKVKSGTGEDTASATVSVFDKPGAPEGPLEVSDITKECCTLSWNPPKDDGGSEIV